MDAPVALPRSPYFGVLAQLNRENRGDHKVIMVNEVDMSSVERIRNAAKADGRPRPTYTALMVKAVSLALREHPAANRIPIRTLLGWRVYQMLAIDVAVAVERDAPGREQAAYVDTIRDADGKDLGQLGDELAALARSTPETHPRWRLFQRLVERTPGWFSAWVAGLPATSARLWQEHRGGAVCISSPAKYGVDAIHACWPWPIGISFGKVRPRAVVVDGRVEPRPTVMLTMAADRRMMAGAPAARFLATVSDHLANAERDLLTTVPRAAVSAVPAVASAQHAA